MTLGFTSHTKRVMATVYIAVARVAFRKLRKGGGGGGQICEQGSFEGAGLIHVP